MEANLQAALADAIDIAKKAKANFVKRPIVRSQRGSDRPSPWFRIWDESTQNVVRLARLLQSQEAEPKTLDAELAALLEEPT